MIDFVKMRVQDAGLGQRLINDSRLTFTHHRGQLRSQKYKDFIFVVYDSGSVEIRGSLHKFFNNGEHNWNDFTRVALWDVIFDLCSFLQISPDQALLHNIEFGVNLKVPYPPKGLLTDLIAHKKDIFSRVGVSTPGTYYQVKTSDYFIKCYDKGTQYQRDEYILRFEVKVVVMRFLKSIGISSLMDLQDVKKLKQLGTLLFNAWDDILIREDLPVSRLTIKEKKIVENATNSKLFETLDRKKRCEVRKAYSELVERYSTGGFQTTNRKQEVGKLLSEKWDELIKQVVCDKLQIHESEDVCDGLQSYEKEDVCDELQPIEKEGKKGRLHSLSIDCKRSLFKTCIITDVSIEKQRQDSFFLSEKTIRENPDVVENLGLKFRRNKRKKDCSEYNYARDTAHNIRNLDSNQRNNLRKRLLKIQTQTSLFDSREVIKLSMHQTELLNQWKGTKWEVEL